MLSTERTTAACSAMLFIVLAAHAGAAFASEKGYLGLLRARDLTPFGLLRLDMRPAHAVSAAPGTWAVETELAYQNTWASSPDVERYLTELPGRRELGPAELQAIRDLPGENYLVDMELAQLDATFHYRFSSHWGAYATVSALSYHGGFLDGAIEQFHDTFGFSTFGRPAASRNDVNLIYDLKSTQTAFFEAPTSGGVLDPIVGVRYSVRPLPQAWNLILEAAAKIPFRGRRQLLSTGHADFGVQATLQRFSRHHALYLSAAGVYYDGAASFIPTPAQVVPTVIIGYERRLGANTHAIVQGYVSRSVYTHSETDLDELLDTKYQLSVGLYQRIGRALISFAITENLQNVNNTPDIGFQLGWAYSPALGARGDRS